MILSGISLLVYKMLWHKQCSVINWVVLSWNRLLFFYFLLQVFGGVLVNLNSVLDWLSWIKYISIFRYAIEVIQLTLYSSFRIKVVQFYTPIIKPSKCKYRQCHEIDHFVGLPDFHSQLKWVNLYSAFPKDLGRFIELYKVWKINKNQIKYLLNSNKKSNNLF